MVMVAIVMGLSVAQTLRGLSKIARCEKRFAPVTVWAALLLYAHFQLWWALWDMSQVETWTQLRFAAVVAVPALLFGVTELLLPLNSRSTTDWRAHFISVRVWFYGTFVILAILITLQSWWLLGVPLNHPYRLFQFVIIGTLAAGILIRREGAHLWLAIIMFGSLVSGQLLFRLLPGLA